MELHSALSLSHLTHLDIHVPFKVFFKDTCLGQGLYQELKHSHRTQTVLEARPLLLLHNVVWAFFKQDDLIKKSCTASHWLDGFSASTWQSPVVCTLDVSRLVCFPMTVPYAQSGVFIRPNLSPYLI